MTSKEALENLFDLRVWDHARCNLKECKKCHEVIQKNCSVYQYYKIIEKDLDILDDFIKLFEGEDIEGWIEFDFHLDHIPEHYFNDKNAFCSIARRIQNYLKEVNK